jgi:hypothetical protein
MSERVPPADLSKARTYPLSERANKVSVREFARPVAPAGSLASFLEGLSGLLSARRSRARSPPRSRDARERGKPSSRHGRHVVKVGLAPS